MEVSEFQAIGVKIIDSQKLLNGMTEWLCVTENMALVIAILGFVLSLYNLFSVLWKNRCSFSVEYKSHWFSIGSNEMALLCVRLIFVNRSSAPFSITRIYLNCKKIDGHIYEFAFPERNVWGFQHIRGKQIVSHQEIYSQKLPFTIEGYGSVAGYFVVYLPKTLECEFNKTTKLSLIVQSSRKKKKFSLVANNNGEDSKDYGR